MIDSDTDVVTGALNSTFDRVLANIDDPDPTDLDCLAASLDALKLSFCELASNQISICPVRRTASECQRFGGAALVA